MMDYNIRDGRTYMYSKKRAAYPFGFGLSYTTFKYSNLAPVLRNWPGMHGHGQRRRDEYGSREGDEVVQLYVKTPALESGGARAKS